MNLTIIGSVALDDVKTPFGEIKDGLGGSAMYASVAASYFADPGIVGVVGDDFAPHYLEILRKKGINLDGLEKQSGQTFHWKGYYEGDMNTAHTLDTQLNVFGDFDPKLPEQYQSNPYVFLANIDPVLQFKLLAKLQQPKFVMLDTMNFWITQKKDDLIRVMREVDMIVVNDGEARQLTGEINLIKAAQALQQLGPRGVMIKKGEHGVIILWEDKRAVVPGVPLDQVNDPTGAGDTYAGAFIGALSKANDLSIETIHRAAVMGTVMASFVVQDFSVNQLVRLDHALIEQRLDTLKKMVNIS